MTKIKILTGQLRGNVVDGFYIGVQEYPNQLKERIFSDQELMDLYENSDGVWIPLFKQRITVGRLLQVTDALYYENMIDFVTPFDKYNQPVEVGDTLFVASSNSVRKAIVTMIASEVTFTSGVYTRKLTVKDVDNDQVLVITNSKDTVRIGND